MSDWKRVQLGDLCDAERGITYGIVKVGNYIPDGIPVIRGGDIRDNRIVFDDEKRVSPDVSNQFRRTILQGGEIVLNLIAEPGHNAVVPQAMAGFNVSRDVAVIPLSEQANHVFVNYFLKSPEAVSWLEARLNGSVTQKINLGVLREVLVPLPPPSCQDAIAEILGALDDKIAVNDRIIATSDKLCGVTMSGILQGDLEIPVVPLSDIADVNRRKVIPVSSGSLRYIDISSVSVGRVEWPQLSSWNDAPGRARRGVSPGDVIWSTVRPNRKSFALILDNDPALVASTGFAVLTPTKVGSAYLYEVTKRDEFVQYLESAAEGSAYPAVRAERFGQAMLPLPSPDRLDKFESTAMSLRRRAHIADMESRTLATLRDELLPKLMSGEVRVRDAEKVVEDVT